MIVYPATGCLRKAAYESSRSLFCHWASPDTAGFGAPTSRAALEHVAVVQEAVQHGGDSGAVAQQFAPVINGTIGRDQRTGAFIAAHDDLQQFFGG